MLPSLSRTGAIALHTGHDRPQKRIPPSLFSRVVKKLPSLLPRAPCGQKEDYVEDEASVDWIGEALRPPTPGDGADDAPVDGVVVGRAGEEYLGEDVPRRLDGGVARGRGLTPCPSLGGFRRRRRRRRRPRGGLGIRPGVTWGADVFRARRRGDACGDAEAAHFLRAAESHGHRRRRILANPVHGRSTRNAP